MEKRYESEQNRPVDLSQALHQRPSGVSIFGLMFEPLPKVSVSQIYVCMFFAAVLAYLFADSIFMEHRLPGTIMLWATFVALSFAVLCLGCLRTLRSRVDALQVLVRLMENERRS